MTELPYPVLFRWLRAGLTVFWLVATVVVWPWARGIENTLAELKLNQGLMRLQLDQVPRSVKLIIQDFAEDPNSITNLQLIGHERRIQRLEEWK